MILEEETKMCSRCEEEKPVDSFHRRGSGRRSECSSCSARYYARRAPSIRAARRERYPDERARDRERRYGLTPEEFDRRMTEQRSRCAICRAELDAPVVDHDHETGAVRGLLCRPCNSGIGQLRDDPELVRAALAYLEKG